MDHTAAGVRSPSVNEPWWITRAALSHFCPERRRVAQESSLAKSPTCESVRKKRMFEILKVC
jgi:hypothetical protein